MPKYRFDPPPIIEPIQCLSKQEYCVLLLVVATIALFGLPAGIAAGGAIVTAQAAVSYWGGADKINRQ